jgi:transposase
LYTTGFTSANTLMTQSTRLESRIQKNGDKRLVGSKYSWLRNPENMTISQRARFDELMACELKTGMAWALKECFSRFLELLIRAQGRVVFHVLV